MTAPNNGATVHGTVTVSGTVTDVNPDHYYFVVKDHNGTVVAGPGTVNQAAVSSWSWNTTAVPDGNYTIRP
ncbi:MAG: Ig-like domain-containing protein [Candidatus Saccharibacteria bacterium]